jgi:hypothetical protein
MRPSRASVGHVELRHSVRTRPSFISRLRRRGSQETSPPIRGGCGDAPTAEKIKPRESITCD